MHTTSSARRTCIASVSAVEWTATVLMPISLHARWMRSAISPRLAIRSFSMAMRCGSADGEQRLVELDRLAVLDMHGLQRARRGGGDRVHHLHRLAAQDRDDRQSFGSGERVSAWVNIGG